MLDQRLEPVLLLSVGRPSSDPRRTDVMAEDQLPTETHIDPRSELRRRIEPPNHHPRGLGDLGSGLVALRPAPIALNLLLAAAHFRPRRVTDSRLLN